MPPSPNPRRKRRERHWNLAEIGRGVDAGLNLLELVVEGVSWLLELLLTLW